MSERIFTFCDRCNPDMEMPNSRFPDNPGRGWVDGDTSLCIVNFAWEFEEGSDNVICNECVWENQK